MSERGPFVLEESYVGLDESFGGGKYVWRSSALEERGVYWSCLAEDGVFL